MNLAKTPFGNATNGTKIVSTEAMKSFVRMFKPQFADAVEDGTKLQTVRPRPKRMPKPGDKISCRAWTEKPYRSKHRILRESVISEILSIELFCDSIHLNGLRFTAKQRVEFAKADGFGSFSEMVDWFRQTHGLPFNGIVIIWN